MTDLYPAKILDKKHLAEAQVLLAIDVPREVWSGHIYHSQYVSLVLPDMEPWHGTIACRPGYESLEIHVKDVGERSARISALEPGDELQVTTPMGDGFPILGHRSVNVILGAAGVAICAMRPLIQEIMLARGDWRRVMLFYGERTADRFSYIDERQDWKEMNIEIFLTASQPSLGTSWMGQSGYVQDYLLELWPDVGDTVAFVAGKDDMVTDFTHALYRLGMPPNSIMLNI